MNFFSSSKSVSLIELSSQKWEQQLGDKCFSCKRELQANECISICECFLFCHEECFIRKISPLLFQNTVGFCIRCQKRVNFVMGESVYWVCNTSISYWLSVFMAMGILIGLLFLTFKGYYKAYIADNIAYTIIGILLLFLFWGIAKSSRMKVVRVEDVKVMDTDMKNKTALNQNMITAQGMMKDSLDNDKNEVKVDIDHAFGTTDSNTIHCLK